MSHQHHLTDQEQALAALEISELSQAPKEHLDACNQCRDRVGKLRSDLAQLGERAHEFSPAAPPVNLSWSGATPRRRRIRPGLTWGSLAAAAVLLIGIWWSGTNPSSDLTLNAFWDPFNGEQIIFADLDREDEDMFSPFQRFLLGENFSETDDELMELLAPALDEEISLRHHKEILC